MLGASPAIASPAANTTIPAIYGMAGPRRSAARPAATMPIMVPSRKALNTNPYRLRPPRSRATRGITVMTASASAATNVIVAVRPPVRGRRSAVHRPSALAVT